MLKKRKNNTKYIKSKYIILQTKDGEEFFFFSFAEITMQRKQSQFFSSISLRSSQHAQSTVYIVCVCGKIVLDCTSGAAALIHSYVHSVQVKWFACFFRVLLVPTEWRKRHVVPSSSSLSSSTNTGPFSKLNEFDAYAVCFLSLTRSANNLIPPSGLVVVFVIFPDENISKEMTIFNDFPFIRR